MVDLSDIRSRTTNVRDYINGLKDKDKEKFLEVYNNYKLNGEAVDELRDALKDLTVVVFSAAWCGDCKRAMPVMQLLEEQLGLEVLVFSKVKTAPLDPDRQWAGSACGERVALFLRQIGAELERLQTACALEAIANRPATGTVSPRGSKCLPPP